MLSEKLSNMAGYLEIIAAEKRALTPDFTAGIVMRLRDLVLMAEALERQTVPASARLDYAARDHGGRAAAPPWGWGDNVVSIAAPNVVALRTRNVPPPQGGGGAT